MTEANLLTEWSKLLLTSLADAGVTDVVISPGSRSTPLVVATVGEPRITRHEVIDERAAAFFALGLARVTGRAAALVCTSGTAPAHYLPAIIEANLTGTPLLVLSGDRPLELYECHAPQTIDQVKLFGENARAFFDLVPEASTGSLRALRRIAAQAVMTTLWPRGGAVHLNARARKPLEPVGASTPEEQDLARRARLVAGEPLALAAPPVGAPAEAVVSATVELVSRARRGIIVAGPAPLARRTARAAVARLAAATGFALACDAASQLRNAPPEPGSPPLLDGFELALRSPTFRKAAAFDCVVQIGAPPTSGPWEQLVPSLPRVVVADAGWNDPHSSARVLVTGDVATSCDAIARALPPPAHERSAFARWLAAADAAAWRAAEDTIAKTERLVEAEAARALVARAPEGSLLVVGNSLAVRLVDIYTRARRCDVGVLSQRGASGIDGLVAGAAGAAHASGVPVALLLGDVSLLHDLTSLALAARARTPLVICVIHNGGGRIFEQLPLVEAPGVERAVVEHATTPHDTDFSHAAALFGLRHARVTSREELDAALAGAYAFAGATLLEVRVANSGAIDLARRVAAAVETAIAHLAP